MTTTNRESESRPAGAKLIISVANLGIRAVPPCDGTSVVIRCHQRMWIGVARMIDGITAVPDNVCASSSPSLVVLDVG